MPARLWLLLLSLTSLFAVTPLSAPAQMIAISVAIYLIIKLQVFELYRAEGATVSLGNRLAWFLAWPGLNAKQFFATAQKPTWPEFSEWAAATAKTLLGGLLLFGLAPRLVYLHAQLAGWIAMVGIVFSLHFGVFHLVALVWQRMRRRVVPIMDAPVLATSLSEFWSRRWNIAFRDFSYQCVFRPIAKQWNVRAATWAGFLFSGFVHELAISVPAGAGFGLPTCYFLLQGLGISAARQAAQYGIPVRRGPCGWAYTTVFTLPAAYFLFHPPFVKRVILPIITT